jgi:hypothetical protein
MPSWATIAITRAIASASRSVALRTIIATAWQMGDR